MGEPLEVLDLARVDVRCGEVDGGHVGLKALGVRFGGAYLALATALQPAAGSGNLARAPDGTLR
jgi:hypothetical protein